MKIIVICLEIVNWWFSCENIITLWSKCWLFIVMIVMISSFMMNLAIVIITIFFSLALAYLLSNWFLNLIIIIIVILVKNRWFVFKISKCRAKSATFLEIYLGCSSHTKILGWVKLTSNIVLIYAILMINLKTTWSCVYHLIWVFTVYMSILFALLFWFEGDSLILYCNLLLLLFWVFFEVSLFHSFFSLSQLLNKF